MFSAHLHLALLSWQCPDLNWDEYSHLMQSSELAGCRSEVELYEFFSHHSAILRWYFARDPQWMRTHQGWMRWSEANQAQFIFPGHPLYPQTYFYLEEPPLVLHIQGEACWQDHLLLAVVGSREPLAASLMWMESELGAFLQKHEIGTISGGARGVDQRCHALSLRHHRPTIVAVPAGLGVLYPKNLKPWLELVRAGGGCFLSSYPPEQPMFKSQFRRRNQLIAQLGSALLIVEAARRSGTIMTAHLAMEREKDIGIVPGHPLQSQFAGSLDLLTCGLAMVRGVKDLEDLLAPASAQAQSGRNQKNRIRSP